MRLVALLAVSILVLAPTATEATQIVVSHNLIFSLIDPVHNPQFGVRIINTVDVISVSIIDLLAPLIINSRAHRFDFGGGLPLPNSCIGIVTGFLPCNRTVFPVRPGSTYICNAAAGPVACEKDYDSSAEYFFTTASTSRRTQCRHVPCPGEGCEIFY